ncbi:MAG: hypothetical protein KF773_07895 [Deltaproteobacteria bacterium]|nr:hypothetical protein [Deltaproteobacteria bacterium]
MSAGVLARLLAATPLPPSTDDAEELIETYLLMEETRKEILAALPADPARIRGTVERTIVLELLARQEAWREAISSAQLRLRGQQVGVRQLRSYAASGG